MNPVSFLNHLPWPVVFGLIATQGIPYLSQLLTKRPGWWTGIATYALAFLDALVVQLADTRSFSSTDWKVVVGLSLSYTATAFLHHVVAIKGTDDVQNFLITHGVTSTRARRSSRDTGEINALVAVIVVVVLFAIFGGLLFTKWLFLLLVILLLLFFL